MCVSFLKGNAQTNITSDITITQTWVNANTGSYTISDGVTVTFGENLTITNTTQYFEIIGSNVTIDGAGYTVTINGVANFTGLVKSLTGANVLIKNIIVNTSGSPTLAIGAGYIAASYNNATITNCYSSGSVNGKNSGGIAGRNNTGIISNCYSTGTISGQNAGGIAGFSNSGLISDCYSTGAISGVESGGIAGSYNKGNISNCYTSSNISGVGAGGIAAFYNSGNISNCYTSGIISGQYSGGIAGYNNLGAISNCRSSGVKNHNDARTIAGLYSSGSITNSISQVPTTPNTWDNTIADIALTGLGTIWDQSNTPYTLIQPASLGIATQVGSLTSCLGSVSNSPVTFAISGSNLTASVTITAPSYFEISESAGGTYSSSLTLTNTSTVSQTLFVRLSSSASVGVNSGTITATTIGVSDVSASLNGTVLSMPVLSTNAISLCSEATYLITKTTAIPVDNGWTVSGAITVNNGYVTAGTSAGSYTVSYTDGCAQTVSATVVVTTNSSLPAITDGQTSYRISTINPQPQGPLGSGTVNYVGYNGFNYYSTSRPTNPGFYKVNNFDNGTASAGCPYSFAIYSCTNCSN